MFITKEIMNSKLKKSLLPHKKQILNEIKASQADQDWDIDNFYTRPRPKTGQKRQKRPSTAITIKSSARKSTSTQPRTQSQQNQHENTAYLKKVNYQFNQISKIANLFDNNIDFKQKGIKKQSLLSEKVKNIKRIIKERQKQQKEHYQKMKRVMTTKVTQFQPNIYMGLNQQKMRKIIPVSTAKHQDMAMLSRYIKGGYVSEAEEYSQKQTKAEVIKLKKRFLTMNTLYDAVKGKRNQGIEHVKPESIDRNSLENYVYFLENQKTMKIQDKLAIQHKIKMIS